MPLTLAEAGQVLTQARSQAEHLGIRITIAVVDEGGHLQALARMDGAPPLSAQIAESKAVGAAVWHRDGESLAGVHQARPAFFDRVDRLVRMPIIPGLGSVLIRREGAILGAVGVSGGAPEQDHECAEAGLATIA